MTSWHFRLGTTLVAVATLLAVSIGSAGAAPVADPMGPACALYAPRGRANEGSAAAVAQQPLSVFISSNPKLSALSAALSGKLNPAVNLLATLDAGEVTIFAPADSAFSRLPVEATAALRIDAASLTRLLNYHVIPGRFTPADIDGTHQTLQGSELSVTGPADRLWVNDALVLCGGIVTANATLYLIDTVLTPPPGW